MRAMWVFVLLCLSACNSADDPNQPPTLDWGLSTPLGFEYEFDRSSGQLITFSIANAVKDAEDDQLFFVWYWEVAANEKGPLPEVGEFEFILDVCNYSSLLNAERVNVTVAVSDEHITFDKEALMFPIAYNGTPPVLRFWSVELLGECP